MSSGRSWSVIAAGVAVLVGIFLLLGWLLATYHPLFEHVTFLLVFFCALLVVGFALALVGFSRTAGYGRLSRELIRIKP